MLLTEVVIMETSLLIKYGFNSQDVDALGINDNVEGSIKLQFVSPLGFVTEEYGASLDHVIDMVAYTRMLIIIMTLIQDYKKQFAGSL